MPFPSVSNNPLFHPNRFAALHIEPCDETETVYFTPLTSPEPKVSPLPGPKAAPSKKGKARDVTFAEAVRPPAPAKPEMVNKGVSTPPLSALPPSPALSGQDAKPAPAEGPSAQDAVRRLCSTIMGLRIGSAPRRLGHSMLGIATGMGAVAWAAWAHHPVILGATLVAVALIELHAWVTLRRAAHALKVTVDSAYVNA